MAVVLLQQKYLGQNQLLGVEFKIGVKKTHFVPKKEQKIIHFWPKVFVNCPRTEVKRYTSGVAPLCWIKIFLMAGWFIS